MKSSFWFISSFLTIFTLVYGGAHLYIYWRLIHPLHITGPLLPLVRVSFIFLFISFPLIHFAFRHENGPLVSFINILSSVWMGTLVYFFLATLGLDAIRLLMRLAGTGEFFSPVRFTSIVTALAIAVSVYGLVEATRIGVTNLTIQIPNLPKSLEGTTIAQISDVHMGLIVRGPRLEKIVNMVNESHPDIIAITGDLVDEQALHMEDMVEPLKKLKSRYGIYAVTGNHEYFAGIDKSVEFMEKAGVTLLRNRWVKVAGGLQLVGRDDVVASRITGEVVPPFTDIMKGIDHTKPVILLYHTPVTTLEELQILGVQLQLSGHTHQGQLWPFRYIVKRIFKTPYGLFTSGHTSIYVSRGTGTWGPPMRVAAPPEIVLVRLTAKGG
jgi:uncharacterized protein